MLYTSIEYDASDADVCNISYINIDYVAISTLTVSISGQSHVVNTLMGAGSW
jgi:hypothetical protein